MIGRKYSKNDLEDLPTTWGGYDTFPLRSKIFHREGKPIVAMSGKFHTAWGEFGGFKDPEALRFEAASMIAYGARCNLGDQLHPSGLMDRTTYSNIGHAYGYVEKIEEYGIGGLPEATLGLWIANRKEVDEGLCKILLEEQIDFDIARPSDDLSRFETIIIPSRAGILKGQETKITTFMNQGGKVLFIGQGMLTEEGDRVSLPCGADYNGKSPFDIDYARAGEKLNSKVSANHSVDLFGDSYNLPHTPFLNYSSAHKFTLHGESEKLASIHEPYFSRTYAKYCGHQNTPNKPEEESYPAAWAYGNAIVTAHDLDRMYYKNGAKVHRSLLVSALKLIHKRPMVEAGLPSAGRVSLLHQLKKERYAVHLLYGAPIERGNCSLIEDLPELRDISVTLRVSQEIRSMKLIPHEADIPFKQVGEKKEGFYTYEVVVPSFKAHCAIIARY